MLLNISGAKHESEKKNAQTLHVRDYLSNYISLNMKDVSELRLPNDVGELVRICAHM